MRGIAGLVEAGIGVALQDPDGLGMTMRGVVGQGSERQGIETEIQRRKENVGVQG